MTRWRAVYADGEARTFWSPVSQAVAFASRLRPVVVVEVVPC